MQNNEILTTNQNKPLRYDELTEDAQGIAIEEVSERNPIQTRDRNLDELVQDYEYNQHGEILEDAPEYFEEDEYAGLDPEYYESLLD